MVASNDSCVADIPEIPVPTSRVTTRSSTKIKKVNKSNKALKSETSKTSKIGNSNTFLNVESDVYTPINTPNDQSSFLT